MRIVLLILSAMTFLMVGAHAKTYSFGISTVEIDPPQEHLNMGSNPYSINNRMLLDWSFSDAKLPNSKGMIKVYKNLSSDNNSEFGLEEQKSYVSLFNQSRPLIVRPNSNSLVQIWKLPGQKESYFISSLTQEHNLTMEVRVGFTVDNAEALRLAIDQINLLYQSIKFEGRVFLPPLLKADDHAILIDEQFTKPVNYKSSTSNQSALPFTSKQGQAVPELPNQKTEVETSWFKIFGALLAILLGCLGIIWILRKSPNSD